MSTILVNAPFSAPDGTALDAYTSVVGGAWAELPGFDPTYPPAGSISDYVILNNSLQDANAGTSVVVGPEGGHNLPVHFQYGFDVAFSADWVTHTIDFIFCGGAIGPSSFGYALEASYTTDPGIVDYTVYKFADADFTPLGTVGFTLAGATYQSVVIDCNTDTGDISVKVDGSEVITVNDPTPLASNGMAGLVFYTDDDSNTVFVKNLTIVDLATTPSGTTYLSPIGSAMQSFTNGGVPLAGGKLYSFIAGTTTPIATYVDPQGLIENLNPIILDSAGRVPNQIRFLAGDTVKLHLTDANDNAIWTEDNLKGINDVATGGGGTTVDFWIDFGVTPVRASDTSFSIAGNWSSVLHFERRVQLYQSSGSIYGTVLSCTVTEPTPGNFVSTVVIRPDAGTIHSDVSIGYYSSIDSVGSPVPQPYALELRVDALEVDNAEIHSLIDDLQTQIDAINAQLPNYTTKSQINNYMTVTYGSYNGTNTYVYPPGGFSMADLVGFIPSLRTIYFAGKVDYNDTLRTEYTIEPTRIYILNRNSEQRAEPWNNWMAIWKKVL